MYSPRIKQRLVVQPPRLHSVTAISVSVYMGWDGQGVCFLILVLAPVRLGPPISNMNEQPNPVFSFLYITHRRPTRRLRT